MDLQRRGLVRWLAAALALALWPQGGFAQQADSPVTGPDDPRWQAIVQQARGQTVYFNAWGGSDRINDYIAWAAGRAEDLYGLAVVHVRVGDISEVVSRVLAERTAGRSAGGSVDLMWINGENFAAMRENGLLGEPFTHLLPSFRYVDTEARPTTVVDFGVPTDGLESPWGMAQLVFLYDTARTSEPPRSIPALLDWAAAHPGRFAYPQPPDFHGSTFLKQALIALVDDPAVLQRPVDEADFAAVTAPLWGYLDALHPNLWRGGAVFPQAGPQLIGLLDDGEIDIAFNFNPSEASAAIASGQLPDTVRTYVLEGGTLANSHFLAIPFNANARAGALVFADFLLSPEAQLRKMDPQVWGDPTVLAYDRLPGDWRVRFQALPLGIATLSADDLGTPLMEPHPSWMTALEAEWQRRYGS
ncbi:MAG: ABC transporter substrate-binding protein [Rhodospirillaceae bacterium]|nr:ABC transporter substrate-binding protein [Rhodospirillaceae bacterium]